MTTIYRTPNLAIDEFEFHISLELFKGRVRRHTRWRLLIDRHKNPWEPIATFVGHKPKALAKRFAPFKRHMVMAEQSVVENQRVAKKLQDLRASRVRERMAA